MISDKGVELIKEFEGLHDGNAFTPILEPKRDPVGLYTLGWGSRYDASGRAVTSATAPITLEDAETLLRRDLAIAEGVIEKYVKVELNANQYDALCSLIFNIGSGNFLKSNLLKAINGKHLVSKNFFTNWSKANEGGKLVMLPGLYARRVREYTLFLS